MDKKGHGPSKDDIWHKEEKEEIDNLRYKKDLTREELNRLDELEFKLNKPEENTQTTLMKYNKVSRIKEHVRSLIPSCDRCRIKQYCDILEEEEKRKCLKRRVYLFTKGYTTFNINREDILLDIALDIFWKEIKEEKNKRKDNVDLNNRERSISRYKV